MVPRDGTRDDETLAELLRRLKPVIEETLHDYRLDEGEAEEVLSELLYRLIYRWDRIGNRELWLLAALRRACRRRLQERGGEGPL